jgi:dTDP-4-dehydrorhamnose 3,5-epimerase
VETSIITTPLPDLLIVETRYFRDERGFFIENYNQRDFEKAGLPTLFVQDNHSRSHANVLRGLHFQDLTAPMGKLVRCTSGAIFDAAVDLRAGSPAFGKWFGLELSTDNMKQLWVPPGFAHGFAVLTESADVQYKCTGFYTPSAEVSLAWNDPQLGIAWPFQQPFLSKRDQHGLSFQEYLEKPVFHY